jgi:hypothetical protein
MAFVTRAVSASKASKPHMKSDSFTSKTPNNSDPQNADEDSSQQEIANRLTQFLTTPEGQKLKAQMTIKQANQLMIPLLEKWMQTPNEETAQRMLLSLALMECHQAIEKNEALLKTLN